MSFSFKRFGIFFIFLALFLTPFFAYADQLENLKIEREGLQNNISELEAKITEYQKNLDSKRGEITSLKNEISGINTQINKLNLDIKKTESQISLTRIDIRETQTNIQETELSIEEKQEVLGSILRELRKFDDESLLERALKYKTLTEAVKQTEQLDSLQNKMNDVLKDTRKLKNNLENKEVDLKENKKELENKTAQLSVQKSAQQEQKTRKDTVLKVTKGQEQIYQTLLNQVEQQQADLLSRLAKIENDILIQKNFVGYFQAGTIPKPGTKIFAWPEDNARVTQNYGMTKYAKRGAYGGQGHNGIDISAGLASPIKAAAGGKIVAKGLESCQNYIRPSCNSYWGNWVAIQHPGGLVTLYAHMSKISTKSVNDEVQTGDVIGYEGASGNVTGPHLHFSVYTEFFTYNDPKTGDLRISYGYLKTLNPLDYL
ncbi:MAG: peptidoglycan DD-metalloendopeptidase family protein [Patescibacteria group bacterium]